MSQNTYLLLITVGGSKYAREEREILEECCRKGLAAFVVYTHPKPDTPCTSETLSIVSTLLPRDYIKVLFVWLWELFRRCTWLWMRDRKQRSLFVAVIPAIRKYYLDSVFAKRIVAKLGAPRLVLSLLPSMATSVVIVDCMKNIGVLTAGIRTQTTSYSIEHCVINTDILFYKSNRERFEYEEVFSGKGPRLEAGCLMSLPEVIQSEPLSLPDEYVLLLGTAPVSDIDRSDYVRYNEKLFQVAAVSNLPVVFKSHDLGRPLDDEWLGSGRVDVRNYLRVNEIQRNRELIARASLVVSTTSTLLYYAILCCKPLIIVESKIILDYPDEFQTAPITRFAWHQAVTLDHLDWNALRDSARAAKSWFEKNYYLQKGPDYLLNFLLNEAENTAKAGLSAAAIQEPDTQVDC